MHARTDYFRPTLQSCNELLKYICRTINVPAIVRSRKHDNVLKLLLPTLILNELLKDVGIQFCPCIIPSEIYYDGYNIHMIWNIIQMALLRGLKYFLSGLLIFVIFNYFLF